MNEKPPVKNYAYIDGANLDKGTSVQGWKVDYGKFYVWLKDKFSIEVAYIFIGYVAIYENLYRKMRLAGFTLIFKDVTVDKITKITKGNCDADLVLKVVKDVYEKNPDNVIIVSSDGDFSSLILFLQEKNKAKCLISPSDNCSILIMKSNVPIIYLSQLKAYILLHSGSTNKKAPDKDGTSQGSFSS